MIDTSAFPRPPHYVPNTPAELEAVEVARQVKSTKAARVEVGMRVLLPNSEDNPDGPSFIVYNVPDDDAVWETRARARTAILDLRHAPTWALLLQQAQQAVDGEGRWTTEDHPTTGIFGATWAAWWATVDVVAKSPGGAVGKLFIEVAGVDHAATKAAMEARLAKAEADDLFGEGEAR